MNTEMQKLSVAQIVGVLRTHQKIQKVIGPKHRDFDKHGEAIREACAEMARRVNAGDAEAVAVRL